MAILVDSNILIDYLRGVQIARTFLRSVPGDPRVSVASISELIAGAKTQREEAAIRELPKWCKMLPTDLAIADRAGQFLKHYRASHGIDDFDAVIAATADHHGLPLATLNVKHFPMFAKLKRAY